MANEVKISGTPVVVSSSGQVFKGMGTVIGFIPAVTGSIALYDTANNDSTNQVLLSTTVTAGVFLPLNMSIVRGLQAALTTATGTFLFG